VLNDVQQRGLLERFLDENVDADLLRRGLLFALTALLVPFAGRRLWHTFFRRDHRSALVVGLHDPPTPGPPAAVQRHQELLTRGNLWEPAHTLVRRWFQEQAGLSPTHWPSEEVPAFHIGGGWWRRWHLGRQVRRLYRLAAANHSWPVSRHGFRSLVAKLGQLTRALQRGELRWLTKAN